MRPAQIVVRRCRDGKRLAEVGREPAFDERLVVFLVPTGAAGCDKSGDDAETRLRAYAYDYLKIFGEDAGRYGAQAVACYTEDALRRAVDNIREAGADELFLVPTTVDPGELDRTRAALAI